MKKSLKGIVLMFVMAMAVCFTSTKAYAARITQTAQTQDSVTINWEEYQNAMEYSVQIGTDSETRNASVPVVVPANQTSYTFTGLQPGTEYYVKVNYKYQGYSKVNEGYYIEEIKTLPGKVTGLNQSKWWYYIEKVDFEWTPQTGVDGYIYTVKDNKNKVVAQETTSGYSKDGSCKTKNTKVYSVTVQAFSDINGQRYLGEVSDTAYLFTQPMCNQKKTMVTGNKLKITWDKVSGVTGYDVYVSTKEKTGYTKVKSLSKSKNSYTLSKLKGKKISSKKTYYVYIVGKKKVGGTTYTSGKHYTYKVKGKSGSVNWTFD